MPLSIDHVQKEVLNRSTAVLFLHAYTEGEPHYLYVAVAANKLDMFTKALQEGDNDISRYGTILEQGKGFYPPKAVRDKMKQHYAFDTDSLLEKQAVMLNGDQK